MGFAFGVQHVERIFQIGEELLAIVEALCLCEAHVIVVQRVGHDQLLLAAHVLPVGQVIGIGIGVVQEILLGDQLARVGAGTACVPADGLFAC